MPAKVHIECVVEPNFGENAYLLWCDGTPDAWIVDPGLPPSVRNLQSLVERNKLRVTAIVLTHGHADHIAGVPESLTAFNAPPVYISTEASEALTNPQQNLSSDIGFDLRTPVEHTIDLPPGSQLRLADSTWQILDTSGHAPGSRSLYCADASIVIVGDALFSGSIGRTDFHHSDHNTLISNIREHLFTLPAETCVYSGHGPVTTIGDEKETNPYVQAE